MLLNLIHLKTGSTCFDAVQHIVKRCRERHDVLALNRRNERFVQLRQNGVRIFVALRFVLFHFLSERANIIQLHDVRAEIFDCYDKSIRHLFQRLKKDIFLLK
ncbi:hypothetical protein D3C84_918830 [compost metagenome]